MFVTVVVHYIGVLSHKFDYNWAEEYGSLYRGLRYIEVRYFEVLFYFSLNCFSFLIRSANEM